MKELIIFILVLFIISSCTQVEERVVEKKPKPTPINDGWTKISDGELEVEAGDFKLKVKSDGEFEIEGFATISSNVPIYWVGNSAKTKEWGYKNKGSETLSSPFRLFLRGDTVCIDNPKIEGGAQGNKWSPEKKVYTCIYYPVENRRKLVLLDNYTAFIEFNSSYDPTITYTIESTTCDTYDCNGLMWDSHNIVLDYNNTNGLKDKLWAHYSYEYEDTHDCIDVSGNNRNGIGKDCNENTIYELGDGEEFVEYNGNRGLQYNSTGYHCDITAYMNNDAEWVSDPFEWVMLFVYNDSGSDQVTVGLHSNSFKWSINDQPRYDNGACGIQAGGWEYTRAPIPDGSIEYLTVGRNSTSFYHADENGVFYAEDDVCSATSSKSDSWIGACKYEPLNNNMKSIILDYYWFNDSLTDDERLQVYQGFRLVEGNLSINYTYGSSGNTVNVSFTAEDTGEQASVCFKVLQEATPAWRCENSTGISLDADYSEVNVTWMLNTTNSSKTPILTETKVDLYTTSAPPADTCNCPSPAADWSINMSDYCNITTDCDIAPYNLTFTGDGSSGRTFVNATINCGKGSIDLPSNSYLKLGKIAYINNTGG